VGVCFGSSPAPIPPLPPVSSTGNTQELRQIAEGREEKGVGEQPNNTLQESLVLYKLFNTQQAFGHIFEDRRERFSSISNITFMLTWFGHWVIGMKMEIDGGKGDEDGETGGRGRGGGRNIRGGGEGQGRENQVEGVGEGMKCGGRRGGGDGESEDRGRKRE
jgi:hypothetical protein